MTSFVERFGLHSADQKAAAEVVRGRIDNHEIDTLRFCFPDQHGVLRGKTLVASHARAALLDGVSLTSTLLAKDTAHRTVFSVFGTGSDRAIEGVGGTGDFVIVADPTTFCILPWARKAGWVLCDAYSSDGRPAPLATRGLLKKALQELGQRELALAVGIEIELHIFRLEQDRIALEDSGQPGRPPEVSLLSRGYQYLTELRYDAVEPVMELLRDNIIGVGLPLRSLEVEFGPSQFELTLAPLGGLAAADAVTLLRSTVKQVCARNGYHATFMCRPKIPNVISSGWHLHQSLTRTGDGSNAFIPDDASADLSATGLQYLAGLLGHARGASVLACPTINGYRRYRPLSLAPDRIVWARDNRAAMLRVLGGYGQSGTRIENRVGEPAANPYLYIASQVFSGLHGIERRMDPGPSADLPYQTDAGRLPTSLSDALHALRADAWLTEKLGPQFVDYLCHIKTMELERFSQEVTDWEHREYFELF